MPSWLDYLLGQQAPQFPQGQPPPSPPFVPQQMAVAPTFAQAPQMAQDVAAGIADPLLKAGNYLGGIMQGSQQFSWPETIQHGAALAMAMAPGPKGERIAGGLERGLTGAAESAAPAGIRAYHGSPYDFPAFDLSKIGTGEGAQAYGHGLYFAEHEGTAQSYKNILGGREFTVGDKKIVTDASGSTRALDQQSMGETIAANALDDAFNAQSSSPAQFAANRLRKQQQMYPEQSKDINEALDIIGKWQESGSSQKLTGKMYEVNIRAQPEQFLDWDKPLSQQPPIVQDIARNADLSHLAPGNRTRRQIEMWREGKLANPADEPTGNVLHNALTDYGTNTQNNAALTNRLAEAGIPGIRYLDQGSRQAGEGSRNYVVFNDQLIDILKKYGLLGTLGAGTAAPYFAPQGQQQ